MPKIDSLNLVLGLLQQFKNREQSRSFRTREEQVLLLSKLMSKLRRIEAEQEWEEMERSRKQAGKLDNERIPR